MLKSIAPLVSRGRETQTEDPGEHDEYRPLPTPMLQTGLHWLEPIFSAVIWITILPRQGPFGLASGPALVRSLDRSRGPATLSERKVHLSNPLPRIATTILVVDDERLSRRVAYRVLSEEGYRVFEAESAPEALDVLSQARGRMDLVIVDVVMPDCDGVELGRLVREEWPEQRILYMSAHPAEVLVQHGLESLDVPFLAKPYTRDEMLKKVHQALERRKVDSEPSVDRRRKARLKGK